MRTNQPGSRIQETREALRQAALERAREAARVAAEQARQQAEQLTVPQRLTGDGGPVSGLAAQARAGAPTGPAALGAAPAAIGSDAELLAALGIGPATLPPEQAAAFLGELRRAVTGLPPQAVPALAQLLSDPSAFYQAGQALVGSPLQAQAYPDARAIASAATPPNLAQQLAAEPNLTTYPPETLAQLASFREAPSAEVQAALDRAALATLEAIDLEDLTPAIAHIIRESDDPAIKAKLQEKLDAYADERLEARLEDKEKEEGAQQGLSEFQDDIVALAEKTGLGAELQQAAEGALERGENHIEDATKRGRSLWDRVTGAVSGLIEGVTGAIGSAISAAVGAVGDVAEFALDTVGDVWEGGLDLAAAGFDAVGLEGAADAARTAGDLADGAADWVGGQVDNFFDGAGDALGGTVSGLGQTIAHPIDTVKGLAHLVTNPGQIPEIGRALWNEATRHGAAGAIGYLAGSALPAVLSGGSSLTARLGAVAGQSRVLSAAGALVKGSRAAQLATRVASGVGTVARVPGQAVNFVARNTLGRLTSRLADAPRIAAIAQRLGTSQPAQAIRRVLDAVADRRLALNNRIDALLGAGVRRLDDTALGRAAFTEASERLGPRATRLLEARVDFNRATGARPGRAPGEIDARALDELYSPNAAEGDLTPDQRQVLSDARARRGEVESDAARIAEANRTVAPHASVDGSVGTLDDFRRVDEVFEQMARENPGALQALHDAAFEAHGVDPVAARNLIDTYTNSSSGTGADVFAAIESDAAHVRARLEGLVADPPIDLPLQNDQQRLIEGIIATRHERARFIAEATGAPIPENYRVYRGSPNPTSIQQTAEAWLDGRDHIALRNNGVASTSLDPAVGTDFALQGPRQAGTVGRPPGGSYRGDHDNYVVSGIDLPGEFVLFDKYVDGGRSALGPLEQRVQREVLSNAPADRLLADPRLGAIRFEGRLFTYETRQAFFDLLAERGIPVDGLATYLKGR